MMIRRLLPFLLLILPLLVAAQEVTTSVATQEAASRSGPVKIVTLGDSLTEGDGDEGNGGYPARLLKMIEKLRPSSTMVNLGKSGWDSNALINGDQGLTSQLTQAVAQKPDMALVWIGSNDLWYSTYGSDDQAVIEAYTANIDTILGKLHETGAIVFIALLDDQTKRPYALKLDVGYTASDLKRMSRFAERFNQIITEKAREYGALTVDFSKTTLFTDAATLYADGNHPNSAGYDIIARMWFDAIRPILDGTAVMPTPAGTAISTTIPATMGTDCPH